MDRIQQVALGREDFHIPAGGCKVSVVLIVENQINVAQAAKPLFGLVNLIKTPLTLVVCSLSSLCVRNQSRVLTLEQRYLMLLACNLMNEPS